MVEKEINIRYSTLAESSCCLSCGGAFDFSKPQEGEICLDLGCGRGTDVIRMSETVGEKGFVFGVDISDGMIEKANKNIEKFNVKNAKIIKCELEDLKIESNSIDLIISNCTLNHAMDKDKVWKEIFRVLKKNGRFVISDIYSVEDVPEEYSKDPVAIAECWAGAVTKEKYFNIINNSGFNKIDILEESQPYSKGKIQVSSFTIYGKKPSCCCS